MTKKEINDDIKVLKERVQDKKVVIGAERTLKYLKDKKVETVYIAKNCPEEVKKETEYYAKMAKVPVVNLDIDNEELGVVCKKNFFISVLGTI